MVRQVAMTLVLTVMITGDSPTLAQNQGHRIRPMPQMTLRRPGKVPPRQRHFG